MSHSKEDLLNEKQSILNSPRTPYGMERLQQIQDLLASLPTKGLTIHLGPDSLQVLRETVDKEIGRLMRREDRRDYAGKDTKIISNKLKLLWDIQRAITEE